MGCDLEAIKSRALLYQKIRGFFANKGVLEVETPLLCQTGATDVQLQSVVAHRHLKGQRAVHYLQTSPEFAMKRLLASGVCVDDDIKGIYQLTKAFRDDEHGKRHNSEFTLLEWYLLDTDLETLGVQMVELILLCTDKPITVQKLTYKQAFLDKFSINPLSVSLDTLKQMASRLGAGELGEDRITYLDFLFGVAIEPTLGVGDDKILPLVFLSEFPPQMASLAKTHSDKDGEQVASRFELYSQGLELANAYDELGCAKELLVRFCEDNKQRQRLGLCSMPTDERLLAALPAMPPCSGVALGVDRLLMVLLGKKDIKQVLTFSADEA